MKKLAAFLVIILCLALISPAFSQKISDLYKAPVPKTSSRSNVKLSRAEAFSDGNGVYLRWETESETRNLGFYIYRVNEKGAELASPGIVGGAALTSSETTVYGGKYTFFDPNGNLTESYYLESIGFDGRRQTFDRIFPVLLNDLTAVAGASSQDLVRQKTEANNRPQSNWLNLSKELSSEMEANTLTPDINMQRWVAAQPGVKISVQKEGIYRVSRTELQNAGFNVTAPGSGWRLFLDGNEQPIMVGANDSYIEFYGKGIDTPESATKVYYLIADTQNGLRMGTTLVRPLSGNVIGNNYNQSFVQKYRQIYVSQNIPNGDVENFFSNQPIAGSSSPTPPVTTLQFNLTAIDFNSPKSSVELHIQTINFDRHQVAAVLNGVPLGTMSADNFYFLVGLYQIPTGILREGANTLELRALGGPTDISLTESIKVTYLRNYRAIQNQLSFYTSNYRTTTISGFTSPNIRVFDLTYPDNPTLMTGLAVNNDSDGYGVTIPSNRGRMAFAAEDSGLQTASSIVANNPSTLSTAAHNGELMIVSYKDWMTQANDWANYRRSQGMTVEVVDIEDIFDEFSYGTVSTTGMNQFFKYAKNNWQTPPNYILLLGDTSYDFRNYENRAFQNYIPTKRFDTEFEETATDEAFTDFNNDALGEIPIGRIPARNPETVTQLLNKTIVFESTVATAFNRGAVLPSDLEIGWNFEIENQKVSVELPANIPRTFINRRLTDAHNLLLNALNAGPYLVNYAGHGSTGTWNGNFFTISDALALTNAPNYSIYTLPTCLNGYFINTQYDSLGEALLKSPNGGAAAVWGVTGQIRAGDQEFIITLFYNRFRTSNMTRIGDLIQAAKSGIPVQVPRLGYVLLGDPTLKIK